MRMIEDYFKPVIDGCIRFLNYKFHLFQFDISMMNLLFFGILVYICMRIFYWLFD